MRLTKEFDSRDKVRHVKRNDQLYVMRMMLVAEVRTKKVSCWSRGCEQRGSCWVRSSVFWQVAFWVWWRGIQLQLRV